MSNEPADDPHGELSGSVERLLHALCPSYCGYMPHAVNELADFIEKKFPHGSAEAADAKLASITERLEELSRWRS